MVVAENTEVTSFVGAKPPSNIDDIVDGRV